MGKKGFLWNRKQGDVFEPLPFFRDNQKGYTGLRGKRHLRRGGHVRSTAKGRGEMKKGGVVCFAVEKRGEKGREEEERGAIAIGFGIATRRSIWKMGN